MKRSYFCEKCKRNIALVGNQQPPTFHRTIAGAWCVRPAATQEDSPEAPAYVFRGEPLSRMLQATLLPTYFPTKST